MTNTNEQEIREWGINRNREQRNKETKQELDLGIEWINE